MVDLFSQEFIIFTTRQYALASNLSMSAASKKLTRLEKDKLITKITKGVWANTKHPWFDARACVPYLLGKEQGYVSFLTQLHDSGVISQIPKTIQIATSGHGRKLSSPVGNFEFFQIKPELMRDGVTWSNTKLPYQMAEKEKAMFDCLYVATRREKRFSKLPEVDLSDFKANKLNGLIKKSELPASLKSAIEERFSNLQKETHP